MKIKRVFLIVLDSFGIGEMPDANAYGDEGSNTLGAISRSEKFHVPELTRLGLFQIEGQNKRPSGQRAAGSYGRLAEKSKGKDTTIGHWEIAGIVSEKPLPTYPNGFPEDVIQEFEKRTGRKVICNRPYSGTQVIRDYGQEQMETGALIVYTSADSVFQIAAHEETIGVPELYRCCQIARDMLQGEHCVGRVIARPYTGRYPNFVRTANRHDYSLLPPKRTMLDALCDHGLATIGVGKIYDIFAGKSVGEHIKITDNADGMEKTMGYLQKDFTGLCFVNLVDFDMKYGHRNDIDGYAGAISEFDAWLSTCLPMLLPEDVLMITADHGCDPSTKSTDHSREYVPFLAYGKAVKEGYDLGTRGSFADIAATILDAFHVKDRICGTSFWGEIRK